MGISDIWVYRCGLFVALFFHRSRCFMDGSFAVVLLIFFRFIAVCGLILGYCRCKDKNAGKKIIYSLYCFTMNPTTTKNEKLMLMQWGNLSSVPCIMAPLWLKSLVEKCWGLWHRHNKRDGENCLKLFPGPMENLLCFSRISKSRHHAVIVFIVCPSVRLSTAFYYKQFNF